jgi:hypothetical protein
MLLSLYRRGPFPNIREFKHSNTIFFFCLKTVPIVCTYVECTQGRRNIANWLSGRTPDKQVARVS